MEENSSLIIPSIFSGMICSSEGAINIKYSDKPLIRMVDTLQYTSSKCDTVYNKSKSLAAVDKWVMLISGAKNLYVLIESSLSRVMVTITGPTTLFPVCSCVFLLCLYNKPPEY